GRFFRKCAPELVGEQPAHHVLVFRIVEADAAVEGPEPCSVNDAEAGEGAAVAEADGGGRRCFTDDALCTRADELLVKFTAYICQRRQAFVIGSRRGSHTPASPAKAGVQVVGGGHGIVQQSLLLWHLGPPLSRGKRRGGAT